VLILNFNCQGRSCDTPADFENRHNDNKESQMEIKNGLFCIKRAQMQDYGMKCNDGWDE